jgi:hypothetical protein
MVESVNLSYQFVIKTECRTSQALITLPTLKYKFSTVTHYSIVISLKQQVQQNGLVHNCVLLVEDVSK